MGRLVLASGSPRRKQLLTAAGADFFVLIPEADETFDPALPSNQIVTELASRKAKAVRELCGKDDLIVAADTLVFLGGDILGKPQDPQDAARMLRLLSGNMHEVYTGLTLLQGETLISDWVCSKVWFRELTERQILRYIGSGEPLDKAGAYGIQEKGALLVDRIEGDYFNIVGLPLSRLALLLERHFGVELL